MSFNYANLRAAAIRQIADKGRNVIYRSNIAGTLNTSDSTISGNSTSDTTVRALVTQVRTRDIDGSTLQRGDRLVLMAADLLTPDKNGRIIDAGLSYQIVDVEEIKTGDTALLYKLQVRR